MNAPHEDDDDRDGDSFGPPAIPALVTCLHCGEEYESYLIERRRERNTEGEWRWSWCCATPNCSGRGFGFDIVPLDEDWTDEDGNRLWTGDEEDEEVDLGLGEDEDPPDWDRPRKDDDDQPIPY